MATNYLTVSTDYFDNGGHQMVTINTVLDRQEKRLLFIYVDDDALIVSNSDYLRNDLPADIELTDFWLYYLDCADWSTDDTQPGTEVFNMPFEIYQQVSSCLLQHIKNKVKDTDQLYHCNWRQLPLELAARVDDDYMKWLDEHDKMIATDGETITPEPEYILMLAETAEDVEQFDPDELLDSNGIEAKKLLSVLDIMMPPNDADDDSWQTFYSSKIQLIINDQLITFGNTAAVYNGLEDLAKFILSEQ